MFQRGNISDKIDIVKVTLLSNKIYKITIQ